MLIFSLEIIFLIIISSCFGALCGYALCKYFTQSTQRERTIIAAAKSPPFKDDFFSF